MAINNPGGYAWAMVAGLNAALAAVSAKLFTFPVDRIKPPSFFPSPLISSVYPLLAQFHPFPRILCHISYLLMKLIFCIMADLCSICEVDFVLDE